MVERFKSENIIGEIQEEIRTLELEVQKFNKISNNEIVWLFLATIGCWGIPTDHPFVRLIAFFIIFFIFMSRLKTALGDSKPFKKRIQEIIDRLQKDTLEENDFTKARLYELDKIRTDYLTTSSILKINWIFFMGWLFFGSSLIIIIGELPTQL